MAKVYQDQIPFPHVVIDDLFPEALLREAVAELPEATTSSGCVNSSAMLTRRPDGPDRAEFRCFQKSGKQLHKTQITHERLMGRGTRALFALLRSDRVVTWLERLTGIGPLIPDPAYYGSGVHLVGKGGYLEVHSDFNHLLGSNRTLKHRRLNACLPQSGLARRVRWPPGAVGPQHVGLRTAAAADLWALRGLPRPPDTACGAARADAPLDRAVLLHPGRPTECRPRVGSALAATAGATTPPRGCAGTGAAACAAR